MSGPEGYLTLRNMMEELTSLITTAYHDPDPTPPTLRDRCLFRTLLDQLLTRPLTVRQQWLAHYDGLCVFADTVMAPNEPTLSRNCTLLLILLSVPKRAKDRSATRLILDISYLIYSIVQKKNHQCAAIFRLVYR
jgi:hypothetical protein